MEYRSLWNLPFLPNFTDPSDPKFDISEYFFQIQKSQCPKPPTLAEHQEYRAALTKWADDNGVNHPSCEYTHLFYSKDGYPYPGIIATKDIDLHEKIIEVQPHLTVTAKRAYQELKPIFDAHPDVFCKLPANCYSNLDIIMIATYLIAELGKGDKSRFYNVFRIWPKQVDTLIIWEKSELEELQDRVVLEDMIKTRLIFEDFYKKYYLAVSQYDIFKNELITKEAFFKMLDCLGSRVVSEGSFKFLPYYELFNHAAIGESSYEGNFVTNLLIHSTGYESCKEIKFNKDDPYYWVPEIEYDHQPICIYSNNKKFTKGEEIVINYGSDDNLSLIKFFGFCMEFNIYDYMKMPITQIVPYPNKLQMLLKLIPTDSSTYIGDLIIPIYYQSICQNLITYAKLLITKEEEFNTSNANIKQELAAIDKAIELIHEVIDAHPTTLKQDLELLSKPCSYRLFMCVSCRAWRKRIGYHQIYMLEIVKEMLHKIESGLCKKDAIEQPTKVEDGINEFNLKLNRRMVLSYTQMI